MGLKSVVHLCLIIGLASLSTLFFSCSDEGATPEVVNQPIEKGALEMDLEDETYSDDVDDIFNALYNASGSSKFGEGGRVSAEHDNLIDDRFCSDAVVEFYDKNFEDPDTVSVAFPKEGCKDKNGVVRKGKVVAVRDNQKLTVEIKTIDYFVDEVKIEGSRSVRIHLPTERNGDLVFQYNFDGVKLTYPDGAVASRKGMKFVKEFYNNTPFDLSDDQLITLASYNGMPSTIISTNRKQTLVTNTIKEDLVRTISCIREGNLLPVSGIRMLKMTKDGVTNEITMNYGYGTCDNEVEITQDGELEKMELVSTTGMGRSVRTDVAKGISDMIKNSIDEYSYHRDVNELGNFARIMLIREDGKRYLEQLYPNLFCGDTKFDVSKNKDTLTVIFVPSGCVDSRGMRRKGKIKIVGKAHGNMTGKLKEYVITPIGYSVNGVLVEGERKMTVQYPDDLTDTSVEITISIENGKITLPGGRVRTATCEMFVTYKYDVKEDDRMTTVYASKHNKVSYFKGVSLKGYKFHERIASNIIIRNCPVPVSGVRSLTITDPGDEANQYNVTINYGTGTCDNKAMITINGENKGEIDISPDVPGIGG